MRTPIAIYINIPNIYIMYKKYNIMKNLIEKIKAWFGKNWMIVVNYLVIFISYSNIYGKDGVVFAEVLLGLWLFASAAYGMYKLFMKK